MVSNNLKENRNLSAVLFPRFSLQESDIKKILSFFDTLTLFQPWFMERPVFISETDGLDDIRILNPPINLKPEEGFKARLSEYHNWIKHNQDKGYIEFLKATQGMGSAEDTTWEIRRVLRQAGQNASTPEKEETLRWHLILHLAQEAEDQWSEADRMLKALKERKSPLKGAVEEEDEVGLFEDLPPFEPELIMGEYNLRQIFDAWFSLFGDYLTGNELFVTFNRHVMDYVAELRDNFGAGEEAVHSPAIEFKFPDLSHLTLENLSEIKRKFLKDGKIRDFKKLIQKTVKNRAYELPELDKLAKEFEALWPSELSKGTLNVTLKYLPSLPGTEIPEINETLKHFSNKTMILIQPSF